MSHNSLYSFIGNEILFRINFAPRVLEYKFIIYMIWNLIEALSCFHLVCFEVKSSQQEPVGRSPRIQRFTFGGVTVPGSITASTHLHMLKHRFSPLARMPISRKCLWRHGNDPNARARINTQAHLLHTGKELTLLAAPPTASPKLESSNIYGPAPPRLGCRLHACAVVNLWQFSAPFTCVTYASVSRLWAAEKTGTFHNLAKRGGASCLGVFLGSSSCYKWAHFLCVTDPLSSDEFMHF